MYFAKYYDSGGGCWEIYIYIFFLKSSCFKELKKSLNVLFLLEIFFFLQCQSVVPLKKWVVIVPNNIKANLDNFLDSLMKVFPGIGKNDLGKI